MVEQKYGDEPAWESKEGDASYVNIDDICEIFMKTLGSIKGSSGTAVYTWVVYSGMSRDPANWSFVTWIAVAWLVCVIVARGLAKLNRRLVDGNQDYRLRTETDPVMITGGSSGLGLLLTALFSSNGFKTFNLDIKAPPLTVANSDFIQCDIGDLQEVQAAFRKVKSSAPSILINCAGTVSGSLGHTPEIDSETVAAVIKTNMLGTIWATQEALRLNPRLKMTVSISSSTALACPAYASVYASSKAGVRAFYDSLRHEHISTRVLCVLPGQLDTAMFANIATPSNFLAPVTKTVNAASSIYNAILEGRQGELYMPTYTWILPYVLMLPHSLVDIFRWASGLDSAAKPRRQKPLESQRKIA